MLICASGDVQAQGATRSGFWAEVAGGTGTVRNTCAHCDGVTVAFGSVSSFRVGGSLNPRVLVGLEIVSLYSAELFFAGSPTPVEAENGSLAPVVIWYVGGSGFFLKAGAGLAQGTFTVRSTDGEPVTTERMGSSLTFGMGFDIGIMRWFALTANLSTYVTAIGDVHVDGTIIDDVIATVYEAGVGITLR
jgi:hypothetical protein